MKSTYHSIIKDDINEKSENINEKLTGNEKPNNTKINKKLQDKMNQRIADFYKTVRFDKSENKYMFVRKEIQNHLLPYQMLHVFNMLQALRINNVVIDGSSTGTGKTYTSIAACAQLNLLPLIVCPKVSISTWKKVIKFFNIKCIDVINYEQIRKGEQLYLTKKDNIYTWDFSMYKGNVIIIFDEVHSCKHSASMNGQLLLSSKKIKEQKMLLSATLCDKTADFCVFGYMLNFYKNIKHGKGWIESVIRENKNSLFGSDIANTLDKYIYPNKGSKMTIEDLGDEYPMNQIIVESYDLDKADENEINNYYASLDDDLKLVEDGKMRQIVENKKASIIVELAEQYHENNNSIVIFVHYLSTHTLIKNKLNELKISHVEIKGGQDPDVRQSNIDSFQSNKIKCIVCMIQSGGTSISLHDISGKHPRVSLISPTFSRIELTQTLGRIARAGSLSPCVQHIVFCANTYEDHIATILESKKQMIDKLTDDELKIGKCKRVKKRL